MSDLHDVPVLVENTKQGASSDELSHDGELAGILQTSSQHFDNIGAVKTPWVRYIDYSAIITSPPSPKIETSLQNISTSDFMNLAWVRYLFTATVFSL